jgi:hypothetical protein
MQVAAWAAGRMGQAVIPPFYAVGVMDNRGEPIGALIWSELTGANIELTIYGPRAFPRGVIIASFAYAFNALGVSRITVRCQADKPKLIRLIEKMGWRREGTLRRFYGPELDAVIFGMVREDCRWLPKVN